MPFDHVTIDLKEMTKLKRNNTYYLLLIDVATRFVFLRPLVNKQMDTVAQALFGLFCDVGFPVIISMDNGAEFVNQIMQEVVRISEMDRRLFTPYHHRGNGLAERAVRTTSDAIYKLLEGKDNEWDQYIPSTQLFMNLKVSEVTFFSYVCQVTNKFMDINGTNELPASIELLKERLDYMTRVVYPGVRTRSEKVHAKRNSAFEKNNQIRHESFPDGTMVMVRDENRNGKSEPRYEGPFTILRRNKGGVYVLKGRDGT
jgi:transposase InsO family protein